jgi:hypothetical protein
VLPLMLDICDFSIFPYNRTNDLRNPLQLLSNEVPDDCRIPLELLLCLPKSPMCLLLDLLEFIPGLGILKPALHVPNQIPEFGDVGLP